MIWCKYQSYRASTKIRIESHFLSLYTYIDIDPARIINIKRVIVGRICCFIQRNEKKGAGDESKKIHF